MKLSEIKAGDVIVADSGFTCIKPGEHTVKANDDGQLYVDCAHGKHFLVAQVGDDYETLIGFSRRQS